MNITTIPLGDYGANCYLIQEGDHLVAIDIGNEGARMVKYIKELGVQLDYILLTHGHFDHTTAVPEVYQAFPDAKVFIHEGDAHGAGNTLFPLASKLNSLEYLQDGQVFPVGSEEIKVITTPGHSPGSVSFQVGEHLFTGDTLFAGSMGRVDFPGGNYDDIMVSLKKLADLPGNYTVYPGHDCNTTLDTERKTNPYMVEAIARG